jgi:hypothetical protein
MCYKYEHFYLMHLCFNFKLNAHQERAYIFADQDDKVTGYAYGKDIVKVFLSYYLDINQLHLSSGDSRPQNLPLAKIYHQQQ